MNPITAIKTIIENRRLKAMPPALAAHVLAIDAYYMRMLSLGLDRLQATERLEEARREVNNNRTTNPEVFSEQTPESIEGMAQATAFYRALADSKLPLPPLLSL